MLKAAIGLGALLFALPLLLILLLTANSGSSTDETAMAGDPTSLAKNDIPADYLHWYMQAAQTCPGLPWAVLAAIGKVESDHGRSSDPGIHSGANPKGAMGPMQFQGPTWAKYGVDGDGDGVKDVYNPPDAIYAAANMLCANGAQDGSEHGIRTALWCYNHADWYVEKILKIAAQYAAPSGSAAVTKAVAYARAQLGKPYVWGAEGPDAFDCSGLTMRAYQSAGIAIPRRSQQQWAQLPHIPDGQEQPGDLVFFDMQADGPGHVGIVTGHGLMINAPHTGDHVREADFSNRPRVGFARPVAHSN